MMAKRSADEYMTKDHGNFPNGAGPNIPNMATAAQTAGRKIKQPKSRLGSRGTTPTGTTFLGVQQPNGAPQAQQQTFGAVGNGMSFGQTQSFPPGINPRGSFNFQSPQSASFTFGQNTSEPQPPAAFSNAFSNANGSAKPTNQTNGTSQFFSGFGTQQSQPSHTQQSEDTMMESPQKKPFGVAGFGGSNGGMSQSTSGFNFGQSAQASNSMNTNTSVFGQQQPQQSDSATKFGPSHPPNGGFGGSALFGKVSKPEEPGQEQNPFGQSQPNSNPTNIFGGLSQPAGATQENSLFSRMSSPQEPPQAQPSNSFNFGQSQPASNTSFSFGAQQPTQPQPSSSIFSQQPASKQQSFNPFGQSASETPKSGAFSGFGQASAPSQTTAAVTTQSEAPTSVFTFGSTTPSSPKSLSGSGTALEVSKPEVSKPLFNFGSPTPSASSNYFGTAPTPLFQSSSSLYSSAPKPSEQPKLSDDSLTSADKPNLFAGFSTISSAPTPNVSSDGMFGTEKPTSIGQASAGLLGRVSQPETLAEPISQSKPANLFGQTAHTSMSASRPTNLFGQTTAASQSTPRPEATKEPESIAQESSNIKTVEKPAAGGSSLFGSNRTTETSQKFANFAPTNLSSPIKEAARPVVSNSQPPAPVPKSNLLFAPSSTASPQKPHSNVNSATTKDAGSVPGQTGQPVDYVKMKIRTNGPADTPDDLDNDQAMAYSRNYRIHSLHRELQRRLSRLDPSTQDFENVMIYYVAARERLGFSLGSKQTSTKRIGDDGDRTDDGSSQAKRARTDTFSTGPAPPSSNLFGKPAEPSQQLPNPIHQKSASASSSGTSDLFKNMISTPTATVEKISVTQAPPAEFKNPFASLSATAQTSQPQSSNIFASLNKAPATAPPAKSSNIFRAQTESTTPTKSPPKKSAFEVPKFGGSGPVNFMAAFGKHAEANAKKMEADEKRKRKAEDFDSDEDDEEEWERKYAEEQRIKRNKLQSAAKGGFVPSFGSSKPPAKPQASLFTIDSKLTPKFGNSVNEPLSISEDDHQNERSSEEGSGQEGDEEEVDPDYSPDEEEEEEEEEDDDNDGEDNYEEGDDDDDDDDDEENRHKTDYSDDEDDLQSAMNKSQSNKNVGKSLFDRIEAPNFTSAESSQTSNGDAGRMQELAPNNSFKPFTGEAQLTPQAPTPSPFTPSTSGQMPKLAKTFDFEEKPKAVSVTTSAGSGSIFDKPANLRPVSSGNAWENFSRPGTPTNIGIPGISAFAVNSIENNGQERGSTPNPFATDKGSVVFGKVGDHTYQPGNPIVFGTPEKNKETPALNITAATPPPKDSTAKFGSLFGASKTQSSSVPAFGTSTGFSFGQSTTAAPGFIGAASHLMTPSANNSGVSSRATSPGATDNESVATTDSVDVTNDPQTSLMASHPGEEDEDVLFEVRSKALKWYNEEAAKKAKLEPNQYNSVGLGILRVLKHQQTGRTRMVLRAEPGSNVLLNCYLSPAVDYTSAAGGASGNVKFGVITAHGVERWVLKTKTTATADELAQILEANKK